VLKQGFRDPMSFRRALGRCPPQGATLEEQRRIAPLTVRCPL
jgi:hypothetical protein